MRKKISRSLPSNQILRFGTQSDVVREIQRLPPVDDLAVGIMAVFSTERRPAHQTLKHDGTQ